MSFLNVAEIYQKCGELMQKLNHLETNQKIAELRKLEEAEIKIQGWVKSIRFQSKIFIALNDGSGRQNLQIVCPLSLAEKVKSVNFGACLGVRGKLKFTPQRIQICELQAQEIELVNPAATDYPLQKQAMPLEEVRKHLHLRAKTNYFLSIFRLRQETSQAIHDFFYQQGFYWIHTPLITANDAEGAGELFNVTTNEKELFFSKPAKLTVSGQLQAEALAQGLGKVYTFGPCFRAENSHTTRHLAEFWMIEPELTSANLDDVLNLAENLLKYIIRRIIENNLSELEYLEKYNQSQLINKLKKIININFPRITYAESLEILANGKNKFVYNEIKWGMNLQSEHEKYLCQHFDNQPVFVVNYPIELKSFYMKNNPDHKTVACFDLLFPQVGEMIGGSVREDNYQLLKEKAKKIGLDFISLSWYFDLRKFGYAPSAGFGLGLERLLMFLSETENIRDVIPFPRYPQHLDG